jgi:hypothetical protein
MCQRERKGWQLLRVADGRMFCRVDVISCLYYTRIAIGMPKWQAAKEKRADAERLRQARRAA